MKKVLIAALVGSALLTVTVSQATLSLNFSANTGSDIQFGTAGGGASSFDFTGGNAQWHISTTTDGTGSANGLNGYFAGGPWTIGAITTTSLGGSDYVQQAPVTTSGGTVNIVDGVNLLSGTINWIQIRTVDLGGIINSQGSINVTGITYGGANTDLQLLASGAGQGSVVLTFQFIGNPQISNMMLSDLVNGNGPYSTSYSGSIAAVPEPTTVIAGALLLLPLGASTLRILRRNRMS